MHPRHGLRAVPVLWECHSFRRGLGWTRMPRPPMSCFPLDRIGCRPAAQPIPPAAGTGRLLRRVAPGLPGGCARSGVCPAPLTLPSSFLFSSPRSSSLPAPLRTWLARLHGPGLRLHLAILPPLPAEAAGPRPRRSPSPSRSWPTRAPGRARPSRRRYTRPTRLPTSGGSRRFPA